MGKTRVTKKKSVKTTADKTLIVVVLDRSGSMSNAVDATIEGFNGFLKEQQEIPGECAMTLVQFDNLYEVNFANRPIKEVKPLDRESYIPRASTALLDAIGRSLKETVKQLTATPKASRPTKVIFVIQTDGLENASVLYNREQVFDYITTYRELMDWQFVFLGANQDAIEVGRQYGFSPLSSMTYSLYNTNTTFGYTSNLIGSYRKGVSRGLAYTDAMRSAAVAPPTTTTTTGTTPPTATTPKK